MLTSPRRERPLAQVDDVQFIQDGVRDVVRIRGESEVLHVDARPLVGADLERHRTGRARVSGEQCDARRGDFVEAIAEPSTIGRPSHLFDLPERDALWIHAHSRAWRRAGQIDQPEFPVASKGVEIADESDLVARGGHHDGVVVANDRRTSAKFPTICGRRVDGDRGRHLKARDVCNVDFLDVVRGQVARHGDPSLCGSNAERCCPRITGAVGHANADRRRARLGRRSRQRAIARERDARRKAAVDERPGVRGLAARGHQTCRIGPVGHNDGYDECRDRERHAGIIEAHVRLDAGVVEPHIDRRAAVNAGVGWRGVHRDARVDAGVDRFGVRRKAYIYGGCGVRTARRWASVVFRAAARGEGHTHETKRQTGLHRRIVPRTEPRFPGGDGDSSRDALPTGDKQFKCESLYAKLGRSHRGPRRRRPTGAIVR